MPGIIVPFVGETHRDAIAIVGPKFLDQPVVELLRPLSSEKFDDRLPPTWKFGAISPARVDCISKSHLFWIARIPAILRQTDLLNGSLTRKRG